MAVVQVLNSKAQQGLNVFRKNFEVLKQIKPNVPDDVLKSVDTFARALDLPKGSVTKRGKLTQAAKEHMARALERMNLPQTATWQDVVDAIIKEATIIRKAADVLPIKNIVSKTLDAPTKGLNMEAVKKAFQHYTNV